MRWARCDASARKHGEGIRATPRQALNAKAIEVEAKFLAVCNTMNADLGEDATKTTAAEACGVLKARVEGGRGGRHRRAQIVASCTADVNAQASCEGDVQRQSERATSTAKCEPGKLVVACMGTCDASVRRAGRPTFDCSGTCQGTLHRDRRRRLHRAAAKAPATRRRSTAPVTRLHRRPSREPATACAWASATASTSTGTCTGKCEGTCTGKADGQMRRLQLHGQVHRSASARACAPGTCTRHGRRDVQRQVQRQLHVHAGHRPRAWANATACARPKRARRGAPAPSIARRARRAAATAQAARAPTSTARSPRRPSWSRATSSFRRLSKRTSRTGPKRSTDLALEGSDR